MVNTNFCNLVSFTSPPSPLPITHYAAVSATRIFYHSCLMASSDVSFSPETFCPQILQGCSPPDSLQLKHGLFNKVFADTHYQLGPRPCHCWDIFYFTLFYFIYCTCGQHLTLWFFLSIYCLWPLICDKCLKIGTLSLIYQWIFQQLEKCLAHHNTA